ncbi:hypothetical protein NXT3_PB00465 (plasmid) [Sinorhizobium fredii]|uniref:Uncharacterized protein n=1 Tax=Rhizobium fredii TaxID=380 RepID=A0A2L0HCJ1_RHIFR|nr:hypothetical protein NXT3_PB00465 [Sinorhizobium fredii]
MTQGSRTANRFAFEQAACSADAIAVLQRSASMAYSLALMHVVLKPLQLFGRTHCATIGARLRQAAS